MGSAGEWLEKALLDLCKKNESGLGLDLDSDLISGLVSYCEFASPLDAKEYLDNIIGQEAGKSVIDEYLKRRGHIDIGSSTVDGPSFKLHAYVKPPSDESGVKKPSRAQREVASSSKQDTRVPTARVESKGTEKGNQGGSKKKKSGKVVSLAEAAKGSIVFQQGKPCSCQARRHRLISNCLSCGKIVCEQEGEGPCNFCGALVLREGSTYAGLEASVVPLSDTEAAAEAYAKRLVEYDRNSAARTTVIDDQSDYYDIEGSSWLSMEEKELLRKKKEEIEEEERAKRNKVVMTFDLVGRKVLMNEDEVSEGFQNSLLLRPADEREANRIKPNPSLTVQPVFVDPGPSKKSTKGNSLNKATVQNRFVISMDSEDTYTNLRVASFSCYLSSKDENFVLNLGGGIPDSLSAVMSPDQTPRLVNLGRSKNNEPEISVFAADKYFNIKQADSDASKHELEKNSGVSLHLLEQKIRPRTPSVSSEASSWNSQSVLLQGLHRNPSQTKHKRGFGLRFFPIFGCKGPCIQKKAVDVSNKSVDYGVLNGIQQSQPVLKKVEQLSFPVLNSRVTNLIADEQFKEAKVLPDPRNSIEVFGSNKAKKGANIAMDMERKLSILTWDAIPKVQSIVTTSFGSSALSDDMASDASSDLFEIENISAGIEHSVLTRQESCNMSSCMSPATQYAPSEASIQWSVVTASAADFSSVVSDYDEASVSVKGRMVSKQTTNKATYQKDSSLKNSPKGKPGQLLGCMNHKAVRVAESTYRTNEKFER